MATLRELTNQESGIIIYGGDTVGVFNWPNLGDAQMPCTFGGMFVMGWYCPELEGEAEELRAQLEHTYVADIRCILPGECWYDDDEEALDTDMDIVSDDFGDVAALWGYDTGKGALVNRDDDGRLEPTPGEVWRLDGYTIIVPEGWA